MGYCLVIFYANYYVLVTRKHGIKFEGEEFKKLQKFKKVLLIASFVAMLMATILFSIYSISAYHRFFHL